MSDENGADTATEVLDVSATETPEPETPETQTEEVVEDDDQSDGEGSEDDGLEDYEFDGKKARIPKEWRLAMMKEADYRQKTQELADIRRSVEGRREHADHMAEFWDKAPTEFVKARGKLEALDANLEEWSKVDWNRVAAEHGEEAASREYRRYQQLKDSRNDQAREVQAKFQEIEKTRSDDFTKRVADTEAHAKTLKGWTPEIDKKVLAYAETKGITKAVLGQVINPAIYEVLFDAFRGSAISQKTTQAQAKPKPAAAPTVAQTPPSHNRGSIGRPDLGRVSMERYAELRGYARKK